MRGAVLLKGEMDYVFTRPTQASHHQHHNEGWRRPELEHWSWLTFAKIVFCFIYFRIYRPWMARSRAKFLGFSSVLHCATGMLPCSHPFSHLTLLSWRCEITKQGCTLVRRTWTQWQDWYVIRTSFAAKRKVYSDENKTGSLQKCWWWVFFSTSKYEEGWQLQWSDHGSSSWGWWWVGVRTGNQPCLSSSFCLRQEVKMSWDRKEMEKRCCTLRKMCDGGLHREQINLSVQLS